MSGKICQIQSDQAFETLGFASLRIYYWSRMKLAIFPWKRKSLTVFSFLFLIQETWEKVAGANVLLQQTLCLVDTTLALEFVVQQQLY